MARQNAAGMIHVCDRLPVVFAARNLAVSRHDFPDRQADDAGTPMPVASRAIHSLSRRDRW